MAVLYVTEAEIFEDAVTCWEYLASRHRCAKQPNQVAAMRLVRWDPSAPPTHWAWSTLEDQLAIAVHWAERAVLRRGIPRLKLSDGSVVEQPPGWCKAGPRPRWDEPISFEDWVPATWARSKENELPRADQSDALRAVAWNPVAPPTSGDWSLAQLAIEKAMDVAMLAAVGREARANGLEPPERLYVEVYPKRKRTKVVTPSPVKARRAGAGR